MTNQFLENEKISLEDKITKAREGNNENTYKNLIQAYERVLELIRKENVWTDMYSHYKLKIEDEFQDVVSTWKQKGEDIKDHKIYKIEKEITNDNEKIGIALKSMFEKYQSNETKKAIESIIKRKIDEDESFYDVLKSLSNEWDDFTEDNKKCISRTIAGIRNEDCFKALLDNLK